MAWYVWLTLSLVALLLWALMYRRTFRAISADFSKVRYTGDEFAQAFIFSLMFWPGALVLWVGDLLKLKGFTDQSNDIDWKKLGDKIGGTSKVDRKLRGLNK
jgi:hypothetical protein